MPHELMTIRPDPEAPMSVEEVRDTLLNIVTMMMDHGDITIGIGTEESGAIRRAHDLLNRMI